MNLIIIKPEELRDAVVVLADVRADHLRRVLKVTVGQQVRIGQLDGPLGVGVVEDVDEVHVVLRCQFDHGVPVVPSIDLLLALPRPKVLRRLWAQLSAIGVGRIVLTNAERVERHYFDTHILEPGTYQPLLVDGLQQARDTRLPRVSIHRQFRKLIEDELDDLVGAEGTRVVAHPDPSGVSLGEVARAAGDARIVLAVGPEGGWNAFELDLLRAHRFISTALGLRTLRTDTACVALLSVIHEARRGSRQAGLTSDRG